MSNLSNPRISLELKNRHKCGGIREISAKNNENIEETVDFFLEKCFDELNIEEHPGIHFRNRERKLVLHKKDRDSCSYADTNCCTIS